MWLRQLFSESGECSWGRVGSFLALVVILAAVSLIAWRTNAIPPLKEPTLFIVSLFGISKFNETMQAIWGKKE